MQLLPPQDASTVGIILGATAVPEEELLSPHDTNIPINPISKRGRKIFLKKLMSIYTSMYIVKN